MVPAEGAFTFSWLTRACASLNRLRACSTPARSTLAWETERSRSSRLMRPSLDSCSTRRAVEVDVAERAIAASTSALAADTAALSASEASSSSGAPVATRSPSLTWIFCTRPGTRDPTFTSRSAGSTMPWPEIAPVVRSGCRKSSPESAGAARRLAFFTSVARGTSAGPAVRARKMLMPRKPRKATDSSPVITFLVAMEVSFSCFEDSSVFDTDHPVTELEDAVVMGDHHHGVPALMGEGGQGLHHALAGLRVEGGRGLVAE